MAKVSLKAELATEYELKELAPSGKKLRNWFRKSQSKQ
jgi:hypothetical protein